MFANRNIKHLFVITGITFIQARQEISEEPKARQILQLIPTHNFFIWRLT